MQVTENWADLVGTVVSVQREASPPVASVQVEEIRAVPGWPLLLGELAGTTATVRVPDSALGALRVGGRMVLRARLAGPRVVYLSADAAEHRPAG